MGRKSKRPKAAAKGGVRAGRPGLPRKMVVRVGTKAVGVEVTCSRVLPKWAGSKYDRNEGLYDPKGRRIWVYRNGSVAEQKSTLLHELIHALVSEEGLKRRLGLSGQMEEELVRSMETGMMGILGQRTGL